MGVLVVSLVLLVSLCGANGKEDDEEVSWGVNEEGQRQEESDQTGRNEAGASNDKQTTNLLDLWTELKELRDIAMDQRVEIAVTKRQVEELKRPSLGMLYMYEWPKSHLYRSQYDLF